LSTYPGEKSHRDPVPFVGICSGRFYKNNKNFPVACRTYRMHFE
jgi:peptide subunit release factor RF-3